MKRIITAPLLFIVAGCSLTPAAADAGRAVTDRLVARAGEVADGAMTAIDTAETIMETELARLRAARCLNTLPAIRRYAARSPENREVIARDCGLIVELDTARTVSLRVPD